MDIEKFDKTKKAQIAKDAIASYISLVGRGANRNAFIAVQSEDEVTHEAELIPNYAPEKSQQNQHEVNVLGMMFSDSLSVNEAKQLATGIGFNLNNTSTGFLEELNQSVIYDKDNEEVKEFLADSKEIKRGDLVKIKQSIPNGDASIDVIFALHKDKKSQENEELESEEMTQSEQELIDKTETAQVDLVKQFTNDWATEFRPEYGDIELISDLINVANSVESLSDVQDLFKEFYKVVGTDAEGNEDNSYPHTSIIGLEEIVNLTQFTIQLALRLGTEEQAHQAITKAFRYKEKLTSLHEELISNMQMMQKEKEQDNMFDNNKEKPTEVEQNAFNTGQELGVALTKNVNAMTEMMASLQVTLNTMTNTLQTMTKGAKGKYKKDEESDEDTEEEKKKEHEQKSEKDRVTKEVDSGNQLEELEDFKQEVTEKTKQSEESKDINLNSKVKDDVRQKDELEIHRKIKRHRERREGRDIYSQTQGDPLKRHEYLRKAFRR